MAKSSKVKPKSFRPKRKRVCFFCAHPESTIEYKDIGLMKKFMTDRAKITPKRRTGCCPLHQREIARAIKRARVAGIVPYYVD